VRLGFLPTTYGYQEKRRPLRTSLLIGTPPQKMVGTGPYQLKVLGRLLEHALTGNAVLLPTRQGCCGNRSSYWVSSLPCARRVQRMSCSISALEGDRANGTS